MGVKDDGVQIFIVSKALESKHPPPCQCSRSLPCSVIITQQTYMPGPFLGSGDTRGCCWWLPSKTPQASRRDRGRMNAQGAKWRASWCDMVRETWLSVSSWLWLPGQGASSGSQAGCSPSPVGVLTTVYGDGCADRSGVFLAQRRRAEGTCNHLCTCNPECLQPLWSPCSVPGHRERARGAELSPPIPESQRGVGAEKKGLLRPSPRFFALFSMLYETLSPDTMLPETPRLWAMKLCSLRSFVPGGPESQPSVLLELL